MCPELNDRIEGQSRTYSKSNDDWNQKTRTGLEPFKDSPYDMIKNPVFTLRSFQTTSGCLRRQESSTDINRQS